MTEVLIQTDMGKKVNLKIYKMLSVLIYLLDKQW